MFRNAHDLICALHFLAEHAGISNDELAHGIERTRVKLETATEAEQDPLPDDARDQQLDTTPEPAQQPAKAKAKSRKRRR